MSWVSPQLGGLELDSPKGRDMKILDHYTFLGNCPPTPHLSQHFALSEK